jgi:hypothetical protein
VRWRRGAFAVDRAMRALRAVATLPLLSRARSGGNETQKMMGIVAVLLYSQYSFARATTRANA